MNENQLLAVAAVVTDVAVKEKPFAPQALPAAVAVSAIPDPRCNPADVAPASMKVGVNGDGPKLAPPPGQLVASIVHEISGAARESENVSAVRNRRDIYVGRRKHPTRLSMGWYGSGLHGRLGAVRASFARGMEIPELELGGKR